MKKNRVLNIIIVFFTFGIIFSVIFILKNIRDQQKTNNELIITRETINNIKKHYSEYVVTENSSKLYKLEDNNFIEYGEINSDVLLKLESTQIDEKTKYFLISDLGLYIPFDVLSPAEPKVKSNRYKHYIPFNISVVTSDTTSFYDLDDNYLYTINESFEFPIIIKDSDKYGIIYNDELLYIHSDNVKNIYDNINTEEKGKNRIKVLTYHAIYNPEKADCTTSICETLNQFESHLKYIRENDYFTLKLSELEMYLDGKINIPEKSIVLTIDDGTLIDAYAIKLLEQYQSNATLFVITSWVDTSNLNSEYLDLESHTDNMHNQYECPGYGMQGGGILCLPEDQVLNDLKTSQDKLGGSVYFAYPFFDFNARAIELLKKAGFHMAFIGQYDTDGYSYPLVTDKFKVRRKTIFSDISMNEFISYLK